VLEPTRIEDVKERVRDFTKALREVGASELAARFEEHAAGFVDVTQVRRSVDAIQRQLSRFRAFPLELPDLPRVRIAANRLEDVCKEVLRADMIAPARPSLRAQGKRKLGLIVTTLTAAGVCMLVPLTASLSGLDLSDMLVGRRLSPLQVARAHTSSRVVNALVPSADPEATRAVEFTLAGCPGDLPRASSCRSAGPRLFGSEQLQSYEVTLRDQAYGLFVGFSEPQLLGAVGTARVRVAAGPDTPEGRYELPLSASFIGYSPARCDPWRWLTRRCESAQRGARARDEALPVPTLLVDVVAGSASDDAAEAAAKVAEPLLRAQARAAQIGGAVVEIKAVLEDTERVLRAGHYDTARERLGKLDGLFAPLDALALAGGESEPLPPEVIGLRARFETERHELELFQDRAFEAAYGAFSKPRAAGETDEMVLGKVATKLGISRAFIEAIYAEHADQLEAREERVRSARHDAEQQRQAAILKRCGALPTTAWHDVHDYLNALAEQHRVQLRLHECLTPRLDPRSCWSVVCDFDELQAQPDVAPARRTPRKWTFTFRAGRIVAYTERADEEH